MATESTKTTKTTPTKSSSPILLPNIYTSRYTSRIGLMVFELYNNSIYFYMDLEDGQIIETLKSIYLFKDVKALNDLLDLNIPFDKYELENPEYLMTPIEKIRYEISSVTLEEYYPNEENPQNCFIIENQNDVITRDELEEELFHNNENYYTKDEIDEKLIDLQNKVNELYPTKESFLDLKNELYNYLDEKLNLLEDDLQKIANKVFDDLDDEISEKIRASFKDLLTTEFANLAFSQIDPQLFLKELDYSEFKTFLEQLALSLLGKYYYESEDYESNDLILIRHDLNSTYLNINIYEYQDGEYWSFYPSFSTHDKNVLLIKGVKGKKIRVLIDRLKFDELNSDILLNARYSPEELANMSYEERWALLFRIK